MTRDEAMMLWVKADRAGEVAYVEAVEAGAVTADDAHKAGSLAAATMIQQAFAEREEAIRQAGVQQGLDMAKTAVGALKSGSTGDRNEPVHAAFLSTCILAVDVIRKLGGDDGTAGAVKP